MQLFFISLFMRKLNLFKEAFCETEPPRYNAGLILDIVLQLHKFPLKLVTDQVITIRKKEHSLILSSNQQ